MKVESLNYVMEALIGILSVLGIKRLWDILLEKIRANLEGKKLETEIALKKIEAKKDASNEVANVHKQNAEIWKKEKDILQKKLDKCQQEKIILEKEKDDLQNKMIDKGKDQTK